MAFPLCAVAEEFTDAIHAYLARYVEVDKRAVGIVVGIVDEHGSRIICRGRLGNGTDQQVNGDTLLEIGSVGKTFTVVLLQQMIERGEMKLDDPVETYLPPSVRVPARNGKKVTLRHLATHYSGLPGIPDNLDPERRDNPYADYTPEKLYAFLSRYELTRDPGAQAEYSNLGMGLLGHAIALKAGTDYESLVVERICRPLKMDSTRIALTPLMKLRFATGHNSFGEAVSSWDIRTLEGAGGLRSTGNDLLKYVSANLGLDPSGLTPLMQRTQDLGLAWKVVDLPDTKIVSHGGGTGGYRSFIGFDKTRRRGVVVLSNSAGAIGNLGEALLASEWQPDRRPRAITANEHMLASYVGQYRRLPDPPRGILRRAPKAILFWSAGGCVAFLVFLLSRAGSFGTRAIILGCAVLAGGLLAAHVVPNISGNGRTQPQSGSIAIRRDGQRLFAHASGLDLLADTELLPESETRLFERLSGTAMAFSVNTRGKATRLTIFFRGNALRYERISDQPPEAPVPMKPRTAIKLDPKLLDRCVGRYEFPPNDRLPAGMEVTIWREAEQLLARARGENVMGGRFEIYPESDTIFFDKISGARATFVGNDNGKATTLILHSEGLPDWVGKKLKD